ncbi:hypothetical protein [Streptomyces sp. CB03911]|uniref:hypothetical protein n=1 Tax=Streptomycetaceae TaxID=2062 RepID=UPI00093E224F|nr:hypothetical protein [Streptomyces sp. CB03911]OKI13284.1 hypothetical protein A6A07_15380 [Streptomyces sp. CB03911]
MGVILWYQVDFPRVGLKVSGDVRSGDVLAVAEIGVTYAFGEPGSFHVTFADLPLAAHRALAAALAAKSGPQGGVGVDIRLGYLDDPSGRRTVLSGRVDAITSSTRFPPLGMRLTGYEEASYRLLARVDPDARPPLARLSLKESSPATAARRIAGSAGVAVVGEPGPDSFKRDLSDSAKNAFALLAGLAHRYGAELLVQEGAVQFGTAVTHPPAGGLSAPPDVAALAAAIGGEDSLVALPGMTAARLAEFKPVQLGPVGKQSLVTDEVDEAAVSAFDFTVFGLPSLRAGQLVAAGVQGYENPFKGFRVLQLTHSFSPRTGYTCTGRAVAFGRSGNSRRSALARRGTPLAVADLIAGKVQESATVSPAVDVGRVDRAKPAERVASLDTGQRANEAVASPSVDLEITEGDPFRLDKPVASPFAWHKVGLSVPVYKGMRALLNQVRGNPDDSVVTGFLWANAEKMERPKSQEGDWWLCLPTELTSGSSATPTGKGVNDLTAADGRRVVEAVGLKIAVGTDACSKVGERPTEGAAEVFLLTHKSGTEIRIDADGNVTVDGGSQDVVLRSAGVTLTIGKGKVAIS